MAVDRVVHDNELVVGIDERIVLCQVDSLDLVVAEYIQAYLW
jgi:hypothetical protein